MLRPLALFLLEIFREKEMVEDGRGIKTSVVEALCCFFTLCVLLLLSKKMDLKCTPCPHDLCKWQKQTKSNHLSFVSTRCIALLSCISVSSQTARTCADSIASAEHAVRHGQKRAEWSSWSKQNHANSMNL